MKKNNLFILATCFVALSGTMALSACNSRNIVIGGEGNSFNNGSNGNDFAPLTKGASIPSQYPQGSWISESSVRQASAVSWNEEISENSSMPDSLAKQCLNQDLLLESRPGPYNHPISAADFAGNIFYVSAKASNGDGSQAKPFNKIMNAVNAATQSGKTAAILVAGGTYAEDLELQSGIFLFGGFDAGSWERNLETSASIIKNLDASLMIWGNENSADFPTMLDGFTIYGAHSDSPTIWLNDKAAAILRNNSIYLNMGPITWENNVDIAYGTAIELRSAKAQIYQNRFLIDSDQPELVMSGGIRSLRSCATFANNHTQSYRTPVTSLSAQGTVWSNLFEDSYNGITTNNENLHIEGNTIGLLEHENGCGYAIYMGTFDLGGVAPAVTNTRPQIIGNHMVLEGVHSRGINESYAGGDPASLIDNIFIIVDPESKPMLYGDFDQPKDPNKINKSLFTVEEIATMQDIPQIEGNILIK